MGYTAMLNSMHVKYFYDTVRLNSVSKAAKHNCVSQSAVSQAISRLEKMLKHPLLYHNKRSLQLTPQGGLLFEKVSVLVALQEDILSSFSTKKPATNSVSIACTQSFAIALLCPVLSFLQKNHPEIKIHIVITPPDLIKEKVSTNLCDIGILPLIEQKIGFLSVNISSQAETPHSSTSTSMTPPKHLFTSRKEDGFSEIFSKPLLEGPVLFYKSPSINNETDLPLLICEEHAECSRFQKWLDSQESKTFLTINSWEVIAKLTQEGLGIGFIPSYISFSSLFNIVQTQQQPISAKYTLSLFTSKESPSTQLVADSLSLLLSKKNHIT